MNEEQLATLALTGIPTIGVIGARQLIQHFGNATEIFAHRNELAHLIPNSGRIIKALGATDVFKRAEKELNFAQKNQIKCITLTDETYPSRLRECDDAPLALFYRGNADLNSLHIVSIVGTRKATAYAQDICNHFVSDLAKLCPDTLILSGLAYGVDIFAHRAALQNKLPTIGVLAHGLDRIYPNLHRKTAIEMLEQGGLLTEFMSETFPDRQNFVKRNRIVAGMADATIVVESAVKGGGLITAEIANSYNRDCFAFPGRINDEYSAGCNNLIKQNKAALITSAEDFVNAMCWQPVRNNAKKHVQLQLFPDLNEEEMLVTSIIQSHSDGIQINTLVVEADIPINRMSALLFELEMKGIIRCLSGGVYRMI